MTPDDQDLTLSDLIAEMVCQMRGTAGSVPRGTLRTTAWLQTPDLDARIVVTMPRALCEAVAEHSD